MNNVRFILGAVNWQGMPSDGRPEVAFVGRSNVGKSSLLNMLVRRKAIARTSGTPGKTQQFNYYLIDDRFYFVDLPGYGYAKISRTERNRWGKMIGRYLTERDPLCLVFHLIDSRHPPTAQDRDVMAVMKGNPVPYIILLTKVDKISGNQRAKSRAEVLKALENLMLDVPVIMTSAVKVRGREEVLEWIDHLIPS